MSVRLPGGHRDDLVEGRCRIERGDIQSSGELTIPVIADIILDRDNWRPVVNVLNTGGYNLNLVEDRCIEVSARFNAEGIFPETVPAPEEGFAAQIRLPHSIQKILLEDWAKKSKKLLLQALLSDPVFRSCDKAEKQLDIMFELQRDNLHEFW